MLTGLVAMPLHACTVWVMSRVMQILLHIAIYLWCITFAFSSNVSPLLVGKRMALVILSGCLYISVTLNCCFTCVTLDHLSVGHLKGAKDGRLWSGSYTYINLRLSDIFPTHL